MRRIFLIRHGLPDFPAGERYCLGSTDMPLSVQGRLQACQLGFALKETPIEAVFSSPLARAKETAEQLGRGFTVLSGLEEMSAGDWDGLSFREIKSRWPELFEKRGGESYVSIPNSELPEHGQKRFLAAIRTALSMSEGDIAVVAHTTVNQSLVSFASGEGFEANIRRRQDYCSYYVLGYNSDFSLISDAIRSRPKLDGALAKALMTAAGLPSRTFSHCQAVAEKSQELCEALFTVGLKLDGALVYRAALVHDIARALPEHPRVGAMWLEDLGYTDEAALVRQHHELDELCLDEAAVLYIADKCLIEDSPVSIEERFEHSLKRCDNNAALAAHRRRAAEALAVQKMINEYCGKELIK